MNVELLIGIDEMLDYARSHLGDMYKKAPMAVRTAINKAAKEIKKQDEKIAKSTYTDKSDINDLEFEKATTANLQAILKDKGKNVSLTHFSHYAGKNVISAIINTQHGRRRIGKYGNKAFLWNESVFVREGKSRLPIEKLASISSPVQHGNPEIWEQIEPDAKKVIYDNLNKEIERILSK